MTRLELVAVGRLKPGPEQILIEDYQQRIMAVGPALGFSSFKCLEIDLRGGDPGQRRTRENEALRDAASGHDYVIGLDRSGRSLTSRGFADLLAAVRDDGHGRLGFMIGGSDGFDEDTRRHANKLISFGAQTWPHLLVRVMVMEQIYRSLSLLAGHPYHRD